MSADKTEQHQVIKWQRTLTVINFDWRRNAKDDFYALGQYPSGQGAFGTNRRPFYRYQSHPQICYCLELRDGNRLVDLIQSLTGSELSRHYVAPSLRVQMCENTALALDHVKTYAGPLVNIGAEGEFKSYCFD